MPPIFWIIGFVAIFLLFWFASRSNRRHAVARHRASTHADLERENRRLRHVLAEMSVEIHALRYTPPNHW